MEYDFTVVYRAHIKHQGTNDLLRLDTIVTDESDTDDDMPLVAVTT